ncbi:MAG: gliding motility lipoprotein GldB, partial [Bacteroidetes bacterium]|nr:gliding motility lipoprotein GldB [Bacteroidota bacterium]
EIPEYKCIGFNKAFIVPDCMKQLAFHQMPGLKPDANLMETMIFYGKLLYFLDVALPERPDYQKITYTPSQLKWCIENEAKIWGFLISNKFLFTTDSKLILNFIPDAPFTKGFPKESPGRIGWFVGWQIVRNFMDNNPETSLNQLMQLTDSQLILTKSRYKPGK